MSSNTIETKACPFCGGNARFLKRAIGIQGTAGYDWWHCVQCVRCGAAVGYDDNRFREKYDAINAWNKRGESINAVLFEALIFYANSWRTTTQELRSGPPYRAYEELVGVKTDTFPNDALMMDLGNIARTALAKAGIK